MSGARRLAHSDVVDAAVRFGLVAYGLVYLLVGYLAAQLALGRAEGGTAEQASSSGALHALAAQPFGAVLVWGVAAGMGMLVLWRLLQAVVGEPGQSGGSDVKARVVAVLKALIYGSIGASAARVAYGDPSGSGSGGGTDSLTARLMDLPAGQWIVGLVGVGVVGYGANQVRKAWSEDYRDHLSAEGKSGEAGTAYLWFGKAGYAAKGLAIGIVGALFCYAAITHEASKSGGLDRALHEVLQQPFGPVLLLAIAAGIVSYGLFCLARARHLSR